MDADVFRFLYHHIVLPPKLPGEQEYNREPLERELLVFVKNTLASFIGLEKQNVRGKWKIVTMMIDLWLSIDGKGTLNQDTLKRALKDPKSHGAVALHIRAQNCGWIAYYDKERHNIIIDAFEASPTSAAVLEAPGPLVRCFPGQSIAIPATMVDDPLFCDYLAQDLCRLNLEVVREMCPKSNASRDFIEEDRDTVHPGLITEGLMIQLLAFGKHSVWKSFEKHVRDEVNFQDSKLPWRRSPLWFVLKVALQTILQRVFPDSEGLTEYKNFMLYLAAEMGSVTKGMEIPNLADVVTFLRAKIARRIYKLQGQTFDFVSRRVAEIDRAIVKQLQDLHLKGQAPDSRLIPEAFVPVRAKDLETSLTNSREFLHSAMLPTPPTNSVSLFDRSHKQRIKYDSNGLPKLEDDQLSLFDFEAWIDTQLGSISANDMPFEDLCCALAELIQDYSEFANKRYTGIPDAMSLMILVMLELWVALDKLCVSVCPLLREFCPELPKNILEPLLLPRRRQMQRAKEAEEYIQARHRDSTPDSSIFKNPGPDTFAARYFDTSAHHKELRNRIKRRANHERCKRQRVWQKLTDKHQDLLSRASDMSHDSEIDEWGAELHLDSCKKCGLEREAARLSIEVHEWPLPEDDDLAKNIVFELACPRWFAKWRDVTWKIVDDHGRPQDRVTSKTEMNLLHYPATKEFVSDCGQRLTLASTSKSWVDTHYSMQKFPVNFESIAVSNAFRFSLWDSGREVWATVRCRLPKPTIKHLCTFNVIDSSYFGLQYAVESCSHSQNKVMADQRNCYSGMTLHEMSAFGHLRCGERLQWLEMVREVASPSVAIGDDAVHKLLCQAAWELGTRSSETPLRQAHKFLEDLNFVKILLDTLEHRLGSIGTNWNEKSTLHTLVILGLRTLSLCPTSAVERATSFLRRCRKVAMDWCADLTSSLHARVGNGTDERLALLFRIGGICLLTYAVDDDYFATLLSNREDLQSLARSSIVVSQNTPQPYKDQDKDTIAMVLQTMRVLHHAERWVSDLIKEDPSGLNNAIEQTIDHLQVSSPWRFCEGDSARWARSRTIASHHGRRQELHYNILSGELLVDNEPPSRLPEGFTKHELFQRLFGSQTLSVIPSNIEGSTFTSSHRFGSYQVYFGLKDSNLVVKAETPDQILRLVPHDRLLKDFPDCLITNYAHWLDLDSGILEFRHLDQKWQHNPQNWHMFYHEAHGKPSVMKQGERVLIDIHSDFFEQIADVLQSLDAPKHILVTKAPDGTVEAKLVRLHLTFFINTQGALECREHNAVVDVNQDIGCFYNLPNKLVLLGKTGQCHRTVLIPYGAVRIAMGTIHTEISIELPETPRIKYFHYLLDPNLEILSDTSGIIGSLYQAYLHAVTTSVLPDPATKRTGTEEALRILRQARMKSSLPLDGDCVRLLELIAALTPCRQYYPLNLKVMQRVIWNRNLGQLAQHDDFRLVAQEIFNHTSQFSPFHKRKKERVPGLDRGDLHLLDRARSRHVQFHKSEFGGASAQQVRPLVYYDARDRNSRESARSCRVYEVAKLIQNWPSTLIDKEDLCSAIKGWGSIDLQIRPPHQHPYSSLLQLPKLKELWGSLYNQCRMSKRESDTYSLIAVFCMIVFGDSEVRDIRPLLAIAFSGPYPEIPNQLMQVGSSSLNLAAGKKVNKLEIRTAISNNYPLFRSNFAPYGKGLSQPEKRKITYAQKKEYEQKKSTEVETLESLLSRQWPCETLQRPPDLASWQIQSVMDCNNLFKCWNQNLRFYQFLNLVQNQLDAISIVPLPAPLPVPLLPALPARLMNPPRSAPWCPPSLHDLICSANAPHPMDMEFPRPDFHRLMSACSSIHSSTDIHFLVYALRESSNNLRQKYADNLSDSLEALEEVQIPREPINIPTERATLVNYRKQLSNHRDSLWVEIRSALTKVTDVWKAVGGATLRPSITVLSLVSFLAVDKWGLVPAAWKRTLLIFAKLIASIRQCERLITHFDTGDVNLFFREAETVGGQGWDASEIPDWLLLEIESDLTIRKRQAEVAQRMIAPESQENAVLQLNMGEGKTTVITPMIATRLSNGLQLLRIIVLKPLLRQSVNLLSQRLGGLLNRPVYHVPFSRSTRVDENTVSTLQAIYDECQRQRGILIILPEQLLSFRLVGLDLADKTPDLALESIRLEQNLQSNCRTIIDESDEVLDPKFQVIYTRGNQQNVDGESDRWCVIQYVLEEVEKQAQALRSQDKGSLDIDQHSTRYPILHFLRANAADLLLQRVVDAIQNGAIPGLSFHQWAPPIRDSALLFIRFINNTEEYEAIVREAFKNSAILKKLLVLRGLIAHRILQFALAEKRWLVDYGVHPSRCLLAVPFRAKGVPSESAEFGHADVALTLTCLSYYYGGLTEDQVRQCFSLIVKENDAGVEYQSWIARRQDQLPEDLHSFHGVNLEDTQSFKQYLYPHLQYQKGIIDFFLSRVVFPREAKEFPFKLSTSAWDIPSKLGLPLTTGFSGTNDNRYLLPMSMPQRDLPYLLHTNAMVLSQLLREENKKCVLAEDANGHQLPVTELLHLINNQDPPIKVIIDVGALILESGNQETAELWLSTVSKDRASAAIFYDEADEAMVVDRDGYIERLLASSFRERMNLCLVFLDQHHSRGVDLKIPRTYRAAVTLGPRLTKDRLVQACHRMRELGNGQSVAFFMPPEVKHNLNKSDITLTSFDVIQWVLEQTCDYLEKLQPLWAWQGMQHFRFMQAWEALITDTPKALVAKVQEPEAKTLFQLYAPWEKSPYSLDTIQELAWSNPKVKELLQTWKASNNGTTLLYEEQEREISQETQKEQQVCRPPSVEPLKHKVHSEIKHFVRHGRFASDKQEAIRPVFECLSRTSAGRFNIPATIGGPLYVSLDFFETIQQSPNILDDEFLKPVHWVLSSTRNQALIILSQHEVNELLPIIRISEKTTLHLYAPRTTKDMRSFSKLNFLAIGKDREGLPFSPDSLLALEIFSGSLYFDTFTDYERARHFFGLVTDKTKDIIPQDSITSEGFVNEEARNRVGWPVPCPFTKSPLPFLKTWYSIRTKGHGFSQSHIGSVIEGRSLTEDRF
ncbi:hypothetical protein BDW59DRAFT_161697 [Aspergillus cavernicola]|uniref:ubiquitinyl hydrolase 1 n=1 Tax=Aspergillus cavernicola TaxID=176166 RepID=A0ABR4ICK0_9EURO